MAFFLPNITFYFVAMRAFISLYCFCLVFSCAVKPQQDQDNWCLSKCDAAGDEKTNTEHLCTERDKMSMDSVSQHLHFPFRIGIAQRSEQQSQVERGTIEHTIEILNAAFAKAHIQFDIATIDRISTPYQIEDLSADGYTPYLEFSRQYDLQDTISLFIFDYNEHLCRQSEASISCSRRGGFSYILSELTNNIVISKFDLEDHKIIVHEFGHFFGLYHTFETHQFGSESPDGSDCAETGDRICDTPADPGAVYEVYVNYSKCEMINYRDQPDAPLYKPLINNYMSYYKPCYLQAYDFTPQQLQTLYAASRMPIRKRFSQ